MAEVTLKDANIIEVNLVPEFLDTNYIPGYAVAEAERRAYYEDFKQRVEAGEFNGQDGEKGEPGEKGDTPIKGVDYFTEEDKKEMVKEISQSDWNQNDETQPDYIKNRFGCYEIQGDASNTIVPLPEKYLPSNVVTDAKLEKQLGNINTVLATLTTVSEVE